MDREQINELVNEYLKARFNEIEERLAVGVPSSNEAGREVYRDELYEQLKRIEAQLKECDYRDVVPVSQTMLPGAGEVAQGVLARRLLEAKHEALCAEIEASQGRKWRHLLPGGPVVMTTSKGTPRQKTPLLSEVISSFCQAKIHAKKWTDKSAQLAQGRLKTAVELLADKPIGDYTPDDAERLQAELARVPAGFRSKGGVILSTRDAIKKADAEGDGKRLSAKSIILHMQVIQSVFLYAVRKRIIDRSPADGIEGIRDEEPERKPFTDDDLRLIFANLKADAEGKPSRWWVPHILLYTGARLEEICQLHAEDIQERNGVWMFDINREGSKRLKTNNSERFVPIHSELLRMGLMEFVTGIQTGHLFPELPFKKKTGYGDTLSKWAGRRLRRLGITDPLKVANHSFRHTMATRLGSAGVDPQTIDKLQGWKDKDKSMRGRYTHELEAKALQAAIEKFHVRPI